MTNNEALELLKQGKFVTHPSLIRNRFLFIRNEIMYNNGCDKVMSMEFEEMFSTGWRRNEGFKENWTEVTLEGWDKIQFDCDLYFKFEDSMGKTIGYNYQMMMRWLKANYSTPEKLNLPHISKKSK